MFKEEVKQTHYQSFKELKDAADFQNYSKYRTTEKLDSDRRITTLIIESIFNEYHWFKKLINRFDNYHQFSSELKTQVTNRLSEEGKKYYSTFEKDIKPTRDDYDKLHWEDFAAIRILDYLTFEGIQLEDPNLQDAKIINQPVKLFWIAAKKGKYYAANDFFEDFYFLIKQLSGNRVNPLPDLYTLQQWMKRHPAGDDIEIIRLREKSRSIIIRNIVKMVENGHAKRSHFILDNKLSFEDKVNQVRIWWNDYQFHLQFAARSVQQLDDMMGQTLSPDVLDRMKRAEKTGIPIFVNPYYLSLLLCDAPVNLKNSDKTIFDYIFVSEKLIEEFGQIKAWEKEDIIEAGKPNTAGWILPSQHNIHRRYPEVAILIPDTMGRACGGLCVSCQRMYDFQRGNLNFNLDKLKPKENWRVRLKKLLYYYENDSQIRDILITGGDALMSSNRSLHMILDEVYEMAARKKANNSLLKDGEKFAEMVRIRLGTRLPVYLPQRITPELIEVLKNFKEKASLIGFKQFMIQTHFISALEVTPEALAAIKMIRNAGWTITNQMVFTAAGSRKGHTSKLRSVLNKAGVITYYTFSVKGFFENSNNFSTNARAVQEQKEEKIFGAISPQDAIKISHMPEHPETMDDEIKTICKEKDIPFLATDRNVINLPGIGKSMTFRTIGLTADGRRILQFEHDNTRKHSPIVDTRAKVTIIESKAISQYIKQMESMGEYTKEYLDVYGYSIGQTEKRTPLYHYPEYNYQLTKHITNVEIPE